MMQEWHSVQWGSSSRKQEKIYAPEIPKIDYNTSPDNPASKKDKIKIIHIVEKGEFFHKIALKYNCSINDIKSWNNLFSDFLYPGQNLELWIPESEIHMYSGQKAKSEQNEQESGDSYIYYVVQKGDTIWSIAEKFNLKSAQEIKLLNNGLDENNLKPGQKIKIYW